jgi:hypothetical protein
VGAGARGEAEKLSAAKRLRAFSGTSLRFRTFYRQQQPPRKDIRMSMSADTSGVTTPLEHGHHDLIGSDRVEGTNVYRSDGKKIGEIERVMIDKVSGQAAYAVMGFGGFLGMGEDHYPIPWQRLAYNETFGGYEVNLSDEQLKNAPHYATGEEWKWDRARGRDIYDYYGVPPYWPMI